MRHITVGFFCTVALCVVANTELYAQEGAKPTDSERASLKGIPDIYVGVEKMPKVPGVRLHRNVIQSAVELRLRRSGIKVSDTMKAWYLYIYVSIFAPEELRGDSLVLFVSAEFKQIAELFVSKQDQMVTTWHQSTVGHVGKRRASQAINGVINEMVDMFANDYLAANQD